MPIVMAWERHGPWVYPDALPPVGGTAVTRRSSPRGPGARVARRDLLQRDAVGGRSRFSGYDGRAGFEPPAVPPLWPGPIAASCGTENWDASWRPSYPACLGVPRTREIALGYVATLAGELGLDMIQFFDQNLGGVTFPCYAEDHGHPSVPGPWMTTAMTAFIRDVANHRGTGCGARPADGDLGRERTRRGPPRLGRPVRHPGRRRGPPRDGPALGRRYPALPLPVSRDRADPGRVRLGAGAASRRSAERLERRHRQDPRRRADAGRLAARSRYRELGAVGRAGRGPGRRSRGPSRRSGTSSRSPATFSCSDGWRPRPG